MANKKDFVIVVLATFCLTATILTVIPTRSQDNKYDPWLDINDDGKINILDFSGMAKAFLSSGDPTKNVNVVNSLEQHVSWDSVALGQFNISWTNYTTTYIIHGPYNLFCAGFSRLFIHMILDSLSYSGPGNMTVYISDLQWNSSIPITWEHFSPEECNITLYDSSQLHEWPIAGPDTTSILKVEIKAENVEHLIMRLYATIPSGWATVSLIAYLRND